MEFYYDSIKLRRADGKPLAEIVHSIEQALYSGEFKDTTGLAERQEVNAEDIARLQKEESLGKAKEDGDTSLMALYERSVKRIEKNISGQRASLDDYKKKLQEVEKRLNSIMSETPKRNLYTVEIPDDTGENYIDWNKTVGNENVKHIAKALESEGWTLTEEGPHGSMVYEKNGEEIDIFAKRYFVHQYKELARGLGSDKAASQLLSKAGFAGIKYPADFMRGGREDGAKNYVIFNENDAKITDHVRFFRTADGEAYGFTVGGKIYIDPRIANSDTPIHEYAHLWASALKRGNSKEWKNVVGLMKGTKAWDDVIKNYPELKDVDAIADEVIATYSGRRGAERLRKMAEDIPSGKAFEKTEVISTIAKVKCALDKFWKGVADMLHIHYTTAEEVADRVMKDLLDGVDPRKMGEADKTDTTSEVEDSAQEAAEEAEKRISFHKETDEETLRRLEREPKEKVFRAMQVIDGKLYPPMAAAVGGKRVEANELGTWIRADENPDLAIPDIDPKTGKQKVDKKTGELKWKFKLDKGGKDATGKKATDIPAAYTPYWHTSRSPMNDQFKSAWIRPNIVTVECEVPTKQTGRTRKVILSRWCKPVRVLPESEVAERIKEFIGDADVTIPENVVTPKLRVAQEKVGMKIGAPEKGVKKSEQIAEALEKGLTIDNSIESSANPVEGMERAATMYREEQRVVGEPLYAPQHHVRKGQIFLLSIYHNGDYRVFRNF